MIVHFMLWGKAFVLKHGFNMNQRLKLKLKRKISRLHTRTRHKAALNQETLGSSNSRKILKMSGLAGLEQNWCAGEAGNWTMRLVAARAGTTNCITSDWLVPPPCLNANAGSWKTNGGNEANGTSTLHPKDSVTNVASSSGNYNLFW